MSKQANALGKILTAVRKEFGKSSAIRLSDGFRGEVVQSIPTGIEVFDNYVGNCGGLPVGRVVELFSEEGVGKAQPVDAEVLTPTGFKPIGTLHVGDVVIGRNGASTKVTGVYPQGRKDVYRVTLTDGTSTESCLEHLWLTSGSNDVSRGTGGRVRSLGEIIDSGLFENHGQWQAYKHHLPELAPVEFSGLGSLPVHPYLLGTLLGDGGLTKRSVHLHNPEDDVLRRAVSLLPDGDCAHPLLDGCGVRIVRREWKYHTPTALSDAIAELGLRGARSWEKFIPRMYQFASVDDRLELLRGLADTDGHVNKCGTLLEYRTASERLADDVAFVARSLGGIVRVRTKIPTYRHKGRKKKGRPAYILLIRFGNGVVPVSSSKHLARWREREQPAYRSIAKVEKSRETGCVCIRVARPDGLYVTDDFIVTHNSSLCLAMLAAAQRAGATTILSETENGFTEERAVTFGVDPEQLGLFQPDYMEQALQQLELTLDTVKPKEGPYLIAWDSLAATPTKLEIDQGVMNKAAQDNRALLMSRSLRILTQKAARACAILLIVNQTRHKRGVVFGDDTTTPGGNALKFHASIRLQLMGGKAVKKRDEHVGKDLLVFGKKNRFATPFRKARLRLMYDEGFDNDWSTLNLAKDWKLVAKKSRDAEAARTRLKEIGWDRGKARDLAADLGFADEDDDE
ncbi:hypothetical protein LCGC14_0455470 [marine sediment metagenome]|uniref:DOD-type homing endonuclease domain-containing protein n=1 Tax=marine sediment metagenome TaxID=412755 RepID=A0A0F9V3A1_9ZZZZ